MHLALDGRDQLLTEGVHARVVSMPSTNLFASQSDDYREKILPMGVPLLVIEAGSPVGWQSFVGPRIAVIGIDTFGSSAPGPVVMEHYGFTVENVCRQAHRVLETTKGESTMRVGIASDHGGFVLKEQIADLLRGATHEVVRLRCGSTEPRRRLPGLRYPTGSGRCRRHSGSRNSALRQRRGGIHLRQ